MEQLLGGYGIVMTIVMVLLVIAVAVLWIFLPFAIFGTKDILRQLVREQKRTNDLLESEQKLKSDLADLRRTRREA